MTDFPQGGPAYFQVTFLDHPSGNPVDPSAISLGIFDGSDEIAGPFTLAASEVVRDQLGLFHYVWTVPVDQALSEDYTATWTAVIGGATRVGYETFGVIAGGDVQPGGGPSWATLTDVTTYTGATVGAAVLNQAQAVIDMHAGRTYDAVTRTGTRDAYWLKLAVAYEAAWLASQPDMFARLDFTQVGGQRTPTGIAPTAMTLGPLARRALARVSWIKSRSLHVRSAFQDGWGGISPNPDSESNDAYESWSPLR